MTDWSKIIYRNYESKDLDYKAACAWDEASKKACCEIVKDILALANTNGGWLVVGVSETASGFAFKGLTPDQAKSFDTTRLNRFVQNYADPPVNCHVHKVTLDDKLFVVLQVPPFPDTPHVCQKEFPDVLAACAIYVRTDNNESAPLKRSADFRNVVERAVKNKGDQLLTSVRTILTSGLHPPEPPDVERYEKQIAIAAARWHELNPYKDKPYAYRQTAFFPARYQEERFDLATLRKMAENACVDFRGWPFLFIHHSRPDLTYTIEDGLETCMVDKNPFNGGDEFHFWQLRQSGLLFVKQILWEDTLASVNRVPFMFDFDGLATNAGEAVHTLVKLYEGQLDDSEEVVLRFQMIGVKDRPLSTLNPNRLMRANYICKIPEIAFECQRPLADWRAGLIDHAVGICRHVLMRFGWDTPGVGESQKIIEKMLQRRLW
jgi:hypothetical protein